MPDKRWIIGILAFFYLVRLFLIGWMELAPDEAYYWYWAKHLDWSYYDHPPMIAYIMAFFTALGGDNAFSVRIGGLLASLLTLLLLYASCRRLSPDDRNIPCEVLFIANVTLLFSAGCLIQTPDTPLLLFWAATVYCGIRIITGAPSWWWYLWGAALGLGLLSKYTMILIIPCQFAFLILSRNDRHWLFKKEPYLALLLALALFSPVVIWNYQHNWVSFAFQLHRGFEANTKSAIIKLLEYLGGQAGIITPLLFFAFVYYSFKAVRRYRRLHLPKILYLLLLSWPVILFFGYSSMRGGVAQPNWPAPAYIAGLLLFCLIYRREYRDPSGVVHSRSYLDHQRHRRYMKWAIGLALVANVVLHAHLIRPFLPVPPRIDTTQQFHGWRELGQTVNRYIQENPHPSGYFLLADRGTTVAGALFYTGKPYLGIDFSRPERYMFLQNLERLQGKNAMILLHHANDSDLKFYKPYFRELQILGKHTARFRGEEIEEYSVYLVLGHTYQGGWQPYKAKAKAN